MVLTKDELVNEYFEWMYHLVCNVDYCNKVSYKKLLGLLNSIDFVPIMEMDENRMEDGKDFRYQFGFDNGYSNEYIRENLDIYNCTMLEMMVALSYKVENQITADNIYGDRTSQWFWEMITNLGLNHMNDNNFDEVYCREVINNFLNREFKPDGEGSLFKFVQPLDDMRNVDIWCACMWYLNETIYTEGVL